MTNSTPGPFVDLQDVRQMVGKWTVDCGRRIADRRVERGLTRMHLAALSGSTEPTIARIEQGTLNPRDHLKLAIATSLDVEVDALWPFPKIAEVLALTGTAA